MGNYEFRLPDVGEGLHEAEIGTWLVAVGDVVKLDQPVLEVETDKSVVELPAPMAGRVAKIGFETGALAQVGDLLMVIEPVGEETAVLPQTAAPTPTKPIPPPTTLGIAAPDQRILAAPSVRKLALELGVDLTAVSGTGTAGRILATDVEQAARPSPQSAQPAASLAAPPPTAAKVLAAPAIRKMAAELGIDLAEVRGSAENGRVTKEDLEQFATAHEQTVASAMVAAPMLELAEGSETVPLRGIRRSMARRMQESWQTIPHVTNFEEIDATELIHVREILKSAAAERGLKLTYLPIIAKITIQLLAEFPDFNASLDMDGQAIHYHRHVHLGIATATPDGLLVPVVKQAQTLTIFQLAAAINELADQARERKLPPDSLSGSTFTLTNFGSFGGNLGTPIINPPEVAILGSGRIAKKPVVVDDALAIRPILPLALSFDHRLIDGAMAGAFLSRLRQLLEKPQRLLLDMK